MFADRLELTMTETLLIAVAGIAVVLLELAILSVLIVFLSKILRAIEGRFISVPDEPAEAAAPAPVAAPVAAPAAAPVAPSAGIQLIDIDEPTAAVVMAIVSNESGIPLEKLNFKSIKPAEGVQLIDVDDPTAAAIMAIVSNQSGIPLERLSFKSIKKVEE